MVGERMQGGGEDFLKQKRVETLAAFGERSVAQRGSAELDEVFGEGACSGQGMIDEGLDQIGRGQDRGSAPLRFGTAR